MSITVPKAEFSSLRSNNSALTLLAIVLFVGILVPVSIANGTESKKTNSNIVKQPLRVVFFNSPTCHECQKVKKALPAILRVFGSDVQLVKFNLDDVKNYSTLLTYEKHYKIQVQAPPAIFVGQHSLIGDKIILSKLSQSISEAISTDSATYVPSTEDSTNVNDNNPDIPAEIVNRFESFSAGAVALAGLIDGVNPCAFTTIIFLLSMLAHLGKSKRQLAIVGGGFTSAVFVTYFLLGLGALGAVKAFSVNSGLSRGFGCAVGILAFILAGWSLWDYVRIKRSGGNASSATLGLPKSIKQRIHTVIRKGLKTRNLVIGSITIGFLVSLLESLCTGQVYLPTIVFMTRAPGLRASAVSYLLLYNLMFILPLVGILIIGCLGVKSEYMGNFLHWHLATFKLGMAVLFVGLGVLVMATV